MKLSVEVIREFLAAYRRKEIHDALLTRASVLMLLFPKNDSLHFLLTKRTQNVEHHKGQISFPGGAKDSGDTDLIATALRETEEEIGLSKDVIQILGLFDDYWIPSGFVVTPVVGYATMVPSLRLNTHEVAEVLEIPVSFFYEKKNERIVQMERSGKIHEVYFYMYGQNEVWGATAAMIRGFLTALS